MFLPAVSRSRRGFSVLEVFVTVSVLSMIGVSLVQARQCFTMLRDHGQEHGLAVRALIDQERELQSLAASARDGDAPWAEAILQGFSKTFEVSGLEPLATRPFVGHISIGTDEHAHVPGLDLPGDLDGSGAVDSRDVSKTAARLPVDIELVWHGCAGRQDLSQTFYLER